MALAIVLDLWITLKRENNPIPMKSVHSNYAKLHKILGLFCQKLNIQYMADGSNLGFDP